MKRTRICLSIKKNKPWVRWSILNESTESNFHYLAYWELYVESFKGTLQLIFQLLEWESPGIIV